VAAPDTDHTSNDDNGGCGRGRLRRALLDAGVSTTTEGTQAASTRRFSVRYLAELCDNAISPSAWALLVAALKPGAKVSVISPDKLRIIVDTVQLAHKRAGTRTDITYEKAAQAHLADLGYFQSPGYENLKSGESPVDVMVSLVMGLPDSDQTQALLDVVQLILSTRPREERVQFLQQIIGDMWAGPLPGGRE